MADKLIQQLCMLELANRIAPNGDMATIAEVMSRENAILLDIPCIEANSGSSHKDTSAPLSRRGNCASSIKALDALRQDRTDYLQHCHD